MSGLVVEAGHASVGQPVVHGPEAGGRVPAVPRAVQAAVVAAHLGACAADRAGPAGAAAGRLVQHGQVGGRGVGGGPLGGRAPGLPRDGRVGVPEQQLGEVGLLEHLSALVDHPAAGRPGGGGQGGGGAGGGGGGKGEWRKGGQGETQEGGEGEGEGGGVVKENGGVCGAGGGRGG